jgi:hypothetical protein
MSKDLYLKLPNGGFCRPQLIAYSSPTDDGVTLMTSTSEMIGFIKIDENKYDVEPLQVHLMNLIRDSCELKKDFKQIDWVKAFNAFKLEVAEID